VKNLNSFVVIVLLIFVLIPAGVSAMGIEMSLGVWNQDPKGDLSYNGISGMDNLNLQDDLKYTDKTRVFGRVKIDMPVFLPNIYLMATPMEFSGTGSKNTTFQFGDVTFDADIPFSSKLKLDQYDIGFYYGIPGLETLTGGVLNLDLGIDARIVDFNAQLTGLDTLGQTITQAKSLTIPVPMIYAGLQVKPVKWLAAEGEFRGITYGSNHYYDIIGRAKIKPYGPVFAAAGYRYEKLDIDTSGVKADMSFAGPFGEVGVEF
jgi:outer membrane protein